jgi:large subunit ribosomal protein L21
VLSQGRHPKIRIVKFRRRKHHEKWAGHRQNFTEVQITKIKG